MVPEDRVRADPALPVVDHRALVVRSQQHEVAVELEQIVGAEPVDLAVRNRLAVADDAAQVSFGGEHAAHRGQSIQPLAHGDRLREHRISARKVVGGAICTATSGSKPARSSGRPSTSTYCGGTCTVQPRVLELDLHRVAVVVRAAAGCLADDAGSRSRIDLRGEVAGRRERHAPREEHEPPWLGSRTGSLSTSRSDRRTYCRHRRLRRTSTITRRTFGFCARFRRTRGERARRIRVRVHRVDDTSLRQLREPLGPCGFRSHSGVGTPGGGGGAHTCWIRFQYAGPGSVRSVASKSLAVARSTVSRTASAAARSPSPCRISPGDHELGQAQDQARLVVTRHERTYERGDVVDRLPLDRDDSRADELGPFGRLDHVHPLREYPVRTDARCSGRS